MVSVVIYILWCTYFRGTWCRTYLGGIQKLSKGFRYLRDTNDEVSDVINTALKVSSMCVTVSTKNFVGIQLSADKVNTSGILGWRFVRCV